MVQYSMFYEQLDNDNVTACLQRCSNACSTRRFIVIIMVFIVIFIMNIMLWLAAISAGHNNLYIYAMWVASIILCIIGCCCCKFINGCRCPSFITSIINKLCLPRKQKREYKKLQKATNKFYQDLTEILLNLLFEQWIVMEILNYMDDLEYIEIDGIVLNDRDVIITSNNLNESLLRDRNV